MNCGLYKITNVKTGMFYVGSSNDIKRRWRAHRSLLRTNKHQNIYLQNAWNKHGSESFTFDLTAEVEEDRLLVEEQTLLDELFANKRELIYNIAETAGSPMKGKNHTEETKKVLREKLSGEKHPHFGKPVSEEWRQKISKANKSFSCEDEAKMAELYDSGMRICDIRRMFGVKHPTTITRAIKRHKRFQRK
jgi:group I intron endonuclease